jgi:PAS domain S-box-containing protein
MRPQWRRISLQQALYAFLTGLFIGLVLSAFQINSSLKSERNRIGERVDQVADMMSQSASQAAYRLDETLAAQVAGGLLENDLFSRVTIVDDFGNILSALENPTFEPSPGWVRRIPLNFQPLYVYELYYGQPAQNVGHILLQVDRNLVAQSFYDRTMPFVIGDLARNAGLIILLAVVFYLFLTRPLLSVSRQLTSVDINNPGSNQIHLPVMHKNNELGLLAGSLNSLLGAFQQSLDRRRKVEKHLQQSRKRYQRLFGHIQDIYFELDSGGVVLQVSPSCREVLGSSPVHMIGEPLHRFCIDEEECERFLRTVRETGRTKDFSLDLNGPEGGTLHCSVNARQVSKSEENTGIIGSIRDLTRQRLLEEQLRQSQRVEAIGRLAGGVAHDFNNLLTAILGYMEFILDAELPPEVREHAGEVRKSALSASSLTQQLLAFSRKQVMQPKQLNVNSLIKRMHSMLRRLIGEDIELATFLSARIGDVYVDPGQVEQVVMNLAINARDAMPQGGKLTIETADTVLDSEYCDRHHEVEPGAYVMISVSDNGTGMTRREQEMIFEPFFTTKEIGKGTGLGLSTVYGIVRQSGGHIHVYSEKGRGTTFKIYFPAYGEPREPERAGGAGDAARSLDRNLVVLVVEDEVAVRKLIVRILQRAGHTVLEFTDRNQVKKYSESGNRIDLLITDVVMPGLSGPRLARTIAQRQPDMKVLYISGYTDNAVVHHGVLEKGLNFLQKPFSPAALLEKIGEIMNPEEVNGKSAG